MNPEELDRIIAAIEWIRDNRKDDVGEKLSLRSLSAEAGLNSGHAEQIVNRRQKSVDAGTVLKIAKRWNVRLGWMLTGIPPREPFDDVEDLYPSRAEAIRKAERAATHNSDAIETVKAVRLPDGASDPGEQYWVALMDRADTGSVAIAPSQWPGWDQAVNAYRLNPAHSRLWEAAVGFGESPTKRKPPPTLNAATLLPLLEEFLKEHPPGCKEWDRWHREARKHFDAFRPKSNVTKLDRRVTGVTPTTIRGRRK